MGGTKGDSGEGCIPCYWRKSLNLSRNKEIIDSGAIGRLFFFGSFFFLLLLYFYATAITLSNQNQFILSAGFLLILVCIKWSQKLLGDFSRIALVMLSAYLSIRYWYFRTTMTLTYTDFWDSIFLFLLYLSESYGIFTHIMGMFVNISPLQRKCPPLPADPQRLPTVDVFIPTYNEPPEIVQITATACTQLVYPTEKLNIFILDDGGTQQKLNDLEPKKAAAARQRAQKLQTIAAQLGIHYITRARNIHAKAGNINSALTNADNDENHANKLIRKNGAPLPGGELVLILDCDHVPTRDFLQNTVGFFIKDAKLAFVQTPHFFINPTPVEKNLGTHKQSPTENEMFYGGVHLGLDFWNSSFFCGSAAILRRKFLLEVGGLSCDTITEDAATALKLHSKGLNSIYLNKPMTIGLSPESFDGFIIQRRRWAKGMTQILLLKNPLFQKGLSVAQRICYLNACLHWLFGLARMIFFLSPLMFIFFGMHVYNASLFQVLVYAVPHLIASYFVSNFLYGKLRHPFFSELFETIQSIFLVPAVLSVFFRPRALKFRVTPKSVSFEKDSLTRLATPFYLMLVLTILAYPAAVLRYFANASLFDTIIICLVWNTFNLFLMLCCLGVVWESRQLRKAHRYSVNKEVKLLDTTGDKSLPATMVDLSTIGASVVAKIDKDPVNKILILNAKDSDGHQYNLPIQILRSKPTAQGMFLGCRFEITAEEIYRQIIAFVYGDSNRLKYFHQTKAERTNNIIGGFANLIRIGLKGTYRNLKGVLGLSLHNFRMMIIQALFRSKDQRRMSTS
jgi:cellulose synthase (UDP-forming)